MGRIVTSMSTMATLFSGYTIVGIPPGPLLPRFFICFTSGFVKRQVSAQALPYFCAFCLLLGVLAWVMCPLKCRACSLRFLLWHVLSLRLCSLIEADFAGIHPPLTVADGILGSY